MNIENTYIIQNESGEQFEVNFKTKQQLEIWIEMENRFFDKGYKIVE